MASIKQFGIDLGIYGSLAQPKTIIELAKFSEKVGFDSIWLADHVVFPSAINSKYPYSADGSFSRSAYRTTDGAACHDGYIGRCDRKN